MKMTSAFLAAVSAIIVFGGAAGAADNILLAVNKPARTELSIKTSELAPRTTAELISEAPVSDDFDAFSAVNDPLYREGSKEFLQQVSSQDEDKTKKIEKTEKDGMPVKAAPAGKTVLRDAPNSKVPAAAAEPVKVKPLIRKSKLMKVIPADPVKANNTL